MKPLFFFVLMFPLILTAQHSVNEVDSLNFLAFSLKGNAPDTALKLITSSRKIAQQLNYAKGEAISLNIRGLIERDKGELILAEKLFIEALNIQKKINDSVRIASVCNNLADLKSKQEQYTIALSYSDQAINLLEKKKSRSPEAEKILGRSYVNKGNIYFIQSEHKKATQWYEKAISSLKGIGDTSGVILCFENLAGCYVYSGQYKKAQENYDEVLKYYEKKKDYQNLARIYNSIGSAHMLEGEFSKAEKKIEKSIEYSKKIQSALFSNDALKNLYLLAKLKSLRQRTLFSGVVLLLILFVAYMVIRARQKKKEFEIYKQNQTLINNKKIIEVTYLLRKDISHNVHTNIATPLTHIKRFLEPAYKELAFNAQVRDNITKAIEIADTLHIVSRDTSYRLRPENIDWADRIKLSLLALEKNDTIKFEYKFDETGLENVFPDEKGEKISGIVCNLLSNVDRHAQASVVKLDMMRKDQVLYIHIEDNGIGFDIRKVNGIGLESIRSDVKILNGTFDLKSSAKEGTKATLNIPIES